MFYPFFLLFPAVLHLVAAVELYSRADFPADFVFGAATSAYQYEGEASEDGRTPSVWDTFAHSGRTNGANGDVACDGYHKYKDDIRLMSDMGLEAFRFSISWSRLIPNGRGPINPMGLQYYNNFINEPICHGIQPHVTLHHFDHPQALDDEYGGWLSRKIVILQHMPMCVSRNLVTGFHTGLLLMRPTYWCLMVMIMGPSRQDTVHRVSVQRVIPLLNRTSWRIISCWLIQLLQGCIRKNTRPLKKVTLELTSMG